MAGGVKLTADSGRLVLHSPLGDSRLLPVGPLLYRDELGGDLVAFQADPDGRVVRGFLGAAPMMTLERVPFSRVVVLHWILLGLGILVFIGIVASAVGRVIRARLGTPRPEDALPGRSLLVAVAIFDLAFLIALVAVLSSGGLLNGPLTGLKLALALPVIATLCTLGAVYVAARQWRLGAGTRMARFRYSAATAVALLFAWSLMQWNLLGWRM